MAPSVPKLDVWFQDKGVLIGGVVKHGLMLYRLGFLKQGISNRCGLRWRRRGPKPPCLMVNQSPASYFPGGGKKIGGTILEMTVIETLARDRAPCGCG